MERRVNVESQNWLRSFADLMTLLLVFFVIQVSPQAIKSQKESEQQKKLEDSIQEVRKYLKQKDLDKDVHIEINGNQAIIILPDALLFSSGDATLSDRQKRILSGIVYKLKTLKGSHHFEIEGHTDSIPISTEQYPSNWYLSSARALEVLQVFIALGFNQFHLSSQGFGEFRPLVERQIPSSRKKNRRVSIEILGLENLQKTFRK